MPDTKEEEKLKKEEADKAAAEAKAKVASEKINVAADKFKDLVTKLGSTESAKAFIDIYGASALGIKEDKKEQKKEGEKDEKKDGKKDDKKKDPEKLDLGFQADRKQYEVGLPGRPQNYGAAYINHEWNTGSPTALDNPTTLSPESWKTIMDTNKILHGWVIRANGNLARARFAAFELKPKAEAKKESVTNPPVSGVAAMPSQPLPAKPPIPIPDFEVYDAASISIKETKTETERSMAQNGFSSEAIEASANASGSGIGWGFSVAASGGYSTQRQSGRSEGDFVDRKEYTATYSFPRARIFVDELDLQLNSTCRQTLADITSLAGDVTKALNPRNDENLKIVLAKAVKARDDFFARYGHIFATVLQIGGQLTATRSAVSLGHSDDSKDRDAMKIAAALSIEGSYKGFSGGVSASYNREKDTSSQTHQSDVSNSSALAWSARGGNTLLCANPAQWANSVASFQTWRTLEQSEVLAIPDLVARLNTGAETQTKPDIGDIQNSFRTIQTNSYQIQPKNTPGTWNGKIRLVTLDGKRLVMVNGKLCIAPDATTGTEVIFTVLDGDIRRTESIPTMNVFYANHPLFLATKDGYGREDREGHQIPGLWVDEWGSLRQENSVDDCICRWSLRLKTKVVDFQHRWGDDSNALIQHRAEVKLYCHSFMSGGGYNTPNDAPYWAPCVMRSNKGTGLDLGVTKFYSDYFSWTFPLINNAYQGQIAWPNSSDYDLIRTSGIDATAQACLRDYDKGKATDDQLKKLATVRNVFGYKNNDMLQIIKLGWASPAQIIKAMSPGPLGVGDKIASQTDLATSLDDIIHRGIQKSTEGQEEAVFRVEFIYT